MINMTLIYDIQLTKDNNMDQQWSAISSKGWKKMRDTIWAMNFIMGCTSSYRVSILIKPSETYHLPHWPLTSQLPCVTMVTLILLMGACHPFHELSILFVSLRYNLSTSRYAAEMCQGGSNTIVFSRLKNSILGIYQSIISSIVYFLLMWKDLLQSVRNVDQPWLVGPMCINISSNKIMFRSLIKGVISSSIWWLYRICCIVVDTQQQWMN